MPAVSSREDESTIPPELRAAAEATCLFDALRRGDLELAARAQEKLRELGWYLSREAPRPSRRTTRQTAPGREVDRHE
jgi:hypothetical protein